MDFEYSPKVQELREKLIAFMDEHVYPAEQERIRWQHDPATIWTPWPGIEATKEKAKAAGIWNLFLPHEYGAWSPGLTNLEYAPLAELMGRVIGSSEFFNCAAPDTGNMEVLAKYGSPDQQERWLKPLLAGEIRSAYVMTEPQVASSDATNVETTIIADGDDYVINGRKWWISGVMDPRTKIYILLGKTPNDGPRHRQHSQILIPANTPGIEIIRPLSVFGEQHGPGGHAEMRFTDVRVPKENLILGEGRGFEIAQGRLGPGRIHHCMRVLGQAQRALEYMAKRVDSRVAFGRKLADQSSIRQEVALSFCEIEQARLLTLKAADAMDRHGNKVAKDLIAAIKIVAPRTAQRVADRAIQSFGGMGVSADTPVAAAMLNARYLRIADGPDEVHLSQLGKQKIAEYASANQQR
ncbi:acyl-CoA dehydrogenase family protein [Sandaracinobacter sp. RS1-74]|uniref:acyl-CoA dehydrogenase family protein n=1 Tax=Sandaracinobacteroides sayramensis TaxID=2913411 RepID=UPI001EDC324B|nr:acyl-CoA dehydrogenase family protein [Sandaracinobacteroides sayramensis]MCG2841136.1 acyl-CoA dehydrogenase family protein [Sandaracinobacteroides sayramensis]